MREQGIDTSALQPERARLQLAREDGGHGGPGRAGPRPRRVADRPKPGARDAIAALKAAGLSYHADGRHAQAPAEAVAREVGIDRVEANVLPEDKVRVVQEVQGQGTLWSGTA